MQRRELEAALVEAIGELEIIDCHEHLGPEVRRVESEVDVFTLFTSYTHRDLVLAGMSEADYRRLFDRSLPLEQRWTMFRPYWEQIRWGSYARAALLAARKFYGVDDINDDTYVRLSEAMRAANKPGIYERMLRDACGILTALTLCGETRLGTPLLTPLVRTPYRFLPAEANAYQMARTWEELTHPAFAPGEEITSLEQYLDAFGRYLAASRKEGAVGLKMPANPYGPPSESEARAAFEKLRDGKESCLPPVNPLRDYLADRMVAMAAEMDMVVAVHTGYWGDFRNVHPLHMIPMLRRHPEARFDVFHLGYPWTRQTLMLGKEFPNVWVNFCWMNIISPTCAADALAEAVDVLPASKVLAFGGDYGRAVEKVYGHLVIARENVARALARHILDGRFGEREALQLARRWFRDNPVELYGLKF